jgi:hypothetical protein
MVLYFLLLLTLIEDVKFSFGINLSVADFLIFSMLSIVCFELKKAGPSENESISYGKEEPRIKITLTNSHEYPVAILFQKYKLIFAILAIYYLILVIYSMVNGYNIHQVMGRFRNLFIYPLSFFAGLFSFKTKNDVQKVVELTQVFFVVSFFIGIVHIMNPISFLTSESSDYYAKIVNQRIGLLSILIFFHALFNYSLSKYKFTSIFLLAICLCTVVFSQNRSIFICYFIATCIYLYWTIFNKKLRPKALILISLTVIIILVSFFQLVKSGYWGQYKDRYTKMSREITGEREFGQLDLRIGRSLSSLRNWVRSPLIGPGFGGHGTQHEIYDTKGNYIKTAFGTSHNFYATILEQTGLIGFVILFFLYFNIYKDIKPREPLNQHRILDYSLYSFFLINLIFNLANVYLYGLVSFIAVSYFFWGLAVANSSMR